VSWWSPGEGCPVSAGGVDLPALWRRSTFDGAPPPHRAGVPRGSGEAASARRFSNRAVAQQPLFRAVDIDVGGTEQVQLPDSKRVTVKLLSISDTRDKARSAIREARAEVEINGSCATLSCGNYRLPVTLGEVQADCTVTKAYYQNTNRDHWGLEKDARLRLWPAGSPFMPPGSMVYPVRQRWFASRTQMANEPTYVDGGERITSGRGLLSRGPRYWRGRRIDGRAGCDQRRRGGAGHGGGRQGERQSQPRPPIPRHDLGAGRAGLVPSLHPPVLVRSVGKAGRPGPDSHIYGCGWAAPNGAGYRHGNGSFYLKPAWLPRLIPRPSRGSLFVAAYAVAGCAWRHGTW